MTFEEAAKKTSSEKVILVKTSAEHLVKVWELHSENIFKRKVNHFVSSVKDAGVAFEQKTSIASLTEGSFFYESFSQTLFIICLDSSSPKPKEISIVYNFFFSTAPVILPYDLGSGFEVEWVPIISKIGNLGQQLSEESTGVVLESSSSVDFINTDGFFDDIYDVLLWENKPISFYLWFPETPITEARKVFEGVIDSKDFGASEVRFSVKDFIYRLRDKVSLKTFSSNDGRLPDSLIGRSKRRIYGQVKQARLAGIDNVLDGFNLTGTISISAPSLYLTGTASGTFISNSLAGTLSGTANTKTITGSGTAFTSALRANDKIKVTNGLVSYSFTVQSIESATSLTVTDKIEVSFSAFSGSNASVGSKKIYGDGTKFLTEVQQGAKVRFYSGAIQYSFEVESVQSNTELTTTDFIGTSFSGFSIFNEDIKNIIVNGSGTNFLKELSPDDEIELTFNEKNYKFKIDAVLSDVSAMITESSDESITNVTAKVRPSIAYRFLNRRWHLAGHHLREPIHTITNVRSDNRFILNSTKDLFAGDRLQINGDFVTLRRISGSEIITETSVSPIPLIGNTVQKLPIQALYFKDRELIWGRDWTYSNEEEAIVTILDDAEFNITKERLLGVNATFKNGSNVVTTTASVDLRSILKPRDWIKKNSIISGESSWYEILDVREQSIFLRSNFTGTTSTTTALIKNVDYIIDDSLITANTLGADDDNGEWLKTPAQVVRDLVLNDAGLTNLNEASFIQAKEDCAYIASMVIPEKLDSDPPEIREVITNINESVFGSLFSDADLNISYAILNAERPEETAIIGEDDLLSYDSQSKSNIYNQIICHYRPFTDLQKNEDTFETVNFNSGFVDKYLGLKNTLTRTLYIYETDKAEIIAQRLALFYSMSSSKVTIKGKMDFFLKAVGDKMALSLDRLFKRFGGHDRKKFAIITGIKKGQSEVELELSDLGNIFNRVAVVSPNTAPDFDLSSQEEKLRFSFVVDNDTLTPNVSSEEGISCNLIG